MSANDLRESVANHVLPRYQAHRRDDLLPLIGAEAAAAAARGAALLVTLTLFGLVIIASVVTVHYLGGGILLGVTLVLCACWLTCFALMNYFGTKAEKLARVHVSGQLGYDIGPIRGLVAPGSWRRSIERMKSRHSHHTS